MDDENIDVGQIDGDAIAAAVAAGTFEALAREARRTLGETEWAGFIDLVVDVSNNGKIDFLSLLDPMASGRLNYAVQSLIEKGLPRVDLDVERLLALIPIVTLRSTGPSTPYFLQNAISVWCDRDAERSDAMLDAVRIGDAPEDLLIPTLSGGMRADRARYLAILTDMLKARSVAEADAAAFVLGRMEPMDAEEGRQITTELTEALDRAVDGAMVRPFEALLNIGLAMTEDVALNAISLVAPRASSEIRVVAANHLWLNADKVSGALAVAICDMLRATTVGEAETVGVIDQLLHTTLPTVHGDITQGLLNDLLRTGIRLEALESTAHQLLSSETGRRDTTIAAWVASGDPRLLHAIDDLAMRSAGEPPTFTLDFVPFVLSTEQALKSARIAVAVLPIFPTTAASIVLSLIRTGPAEAADGLGALLFDPLMLNYWTGPRAFLEGLLPDEVPEVARRIEAAIGRLDAYAAAVTAAGFIREMHPSERHRYINAVFEHERRREIERNVPKSPFDAIFHKSIVLYGDSVVGDVHGIAEEPVRQEFRMQTFEYSQELARIETIDPFGAWYRREMLLRARAAE